MPENVNTSPLIENLALPDDDGRKTMIEVSGVSMVFNMANEQLNSLKEYAIALARRELMFKEFRALDQVSLEVKQGDVYGILGTNGSGKSTLLKIVAGVLEPTEGTCTINGNIAPLIELGAGFDMDLTARENIYLNGSLLGYSKKFIQQHFDEIVEFAEVEKFLDMPLKNYSSGMVARIAFAIATVIVPEILIVDEVLSVGDFMFQQKCERRITHLIKDYGVTVLIVSHNNDQIERLCNKAIWIEKGHTRMVGTAHEVCHTYRVLGGRIGSAESEAEVFETLTSPIAIPGDAINTIAGEDRYGTAVKLIERSGFTDQSERVIIAPGENPSACMIGTCLSGVLDAPLLLCKPEVFPDVSAQSLKRFAPSELITLGHGCENGLDDQAFFGIEEASGQAHTHKIEGDTIAQQATAAYLVGKDLANAEGWGRTAVITYDGCTGDLISLSPYMHSARTPLFFNSGAHIIDEKTKDILLSGAFDRLIVLGGDGQFSEECLQPYREHGLDIVVFCGRNPYHANELINDWLSQEFFTTHANPMERFVISSVWNPADALAGGIYASKTQSAIMLEDPQDLDSVSHAIGYIKKQRGAIKHLTFLGDGMRFNETDKELLGKALSLAQQSA